MSPPSSQSQRGPTQISAVSGLKSGLLSDQQRRMMTLLRTPGRSWETAVGSDPPQGQHCGVSLASLPPSVHWAPAGNCSWSISPYFYVRLLSLRDFWRVSWSGGGWRGPRSWYWTWRTALSSPSCSYSTRLVVLNYELFFLLTENWHIRRLKVSVSTGFNRFQYLNIWKYFKFWKYFGC